MTLQEFIEKAKTDAALNEKVNAAIMEKVICRWHRPKV